MHSETLFLSPSDVPDLLSIASLAGVTVTLVGRSSRSTKAVVSGERPGVEYALALAAG